MRAKLPDALIFFGWALFAVALACPAVGDEPGWKCFLATLCCFPIWIFWPAMFFCGANLMLIFSALVYLWEGGLERKAYGVFLVLAACVTLALTVATLDRLRVGCYLWLGSLFVTATGFLLSDRPDRRCEPPGA